MGIQAVLERKKENVLIKSGDLCVILTPRLGGKIASIQHKGRELLKQPLVPALPRTRDMLFDQSDASGWDECLPSVAACTVRGPDGPVDVPDHGDLWRVEWEAVENGSTSVRHRADCFSLPLRLERTVHLAKTDCGWSLRLDYIISNTGNSDVPWSWAAHPLFVVEPGDSIELPPAITTLRIEGSARSRLGAQGASVAWPLAKLADGTAANLAQVEPASSAIGDKVFAGPLDSASAWCVLHRPSTGLRIRVRFNPSKTPYLGMWLCYGGWPEGSGPKQNCVALEPATAPVDSLAQAGAWSRKLAPGNSYSWYMTVDFELAESESSHA